MVDRNRFRPATVRDLVQLQPALTKKLWRGLAAQITAYPAFALERDGKPVLIVSLVPAAGAIEACVIFGRKPPPLSAMRRLLLSAATIHPEEAITVRIDDANRQGRHMALLTGYRPTDNLIEGTGLRAWVRPPIDPET